ncbi:MAG: hypothetical protein IAF02_28780, partial [Anaerolineae bacterium]|nr:hypothetical protein [Anaerolineae bacterium]
MTRFIKKQLSWIGTIFVVFVMLFIMIPTTRAAECELLLLEDFYFCDIDQPALIEDPVFVTPEIP